MSVLITSCSIDENIDVKLRASCKEPHLQLVSQVSDEDLKVQKIMDRLLSQLCQIKKGEATTCNGCPQMITK